jgi:Ni,Fe-hydrogenase maturation factor
VKHRAPGRVLIGGVGYPDLCDFSAGVLTVEALALETWPPNVVVEDISYGPVAVAQRLQAEPPDMMFQRVILIAAVARGRQGGALTVYRWDRQLPDDVEIHRAVCDAVTGVIHMDNTLIVTGHLRALPDDVTVIEIEPLVHEFGAMVSPLVEIAMHDAQRLARRFACEPSASAALPLMQLGAERPFQVTR